MPERDNQDIIRIVKKWQAAGFVHELTCRVDSTHEALIPIERDGKVVLGCPTCGTAQELLPKFVLESEAWLDELNRRADGEARLTALERRQRTSDLIWSYGASVIGASLLGLFWLGPLGAAGGCALGLLVAYLSNRDHRK